jgi:hypothetical protein
MNNEELKKFIDGIGAIAEMTFLYYKASIKAGASIPEAYILTKAFVEVMFDRTHDRGLDDD